MSSDKIEFGVGSYVTFPAQYLLFAQRLNCCSLHGDLCGTIADKRYNIRTDAMEYAVTLDGGAGEVTIRAGSSMLLAAPLAKNLGCLNKYDLVWYDLAGQVVNNATGEPAALSPERRVRHEENLARAKELTAKSFWKSGDSVDARSRISEGFIAGPQRFAPESYKTKSAQSVATSEQIEKVNAVLKDHGVNFQYRLGDVISAHHLRIVAHHLGLVAHWGLEPEGREIGDWFEASPGKAVQLHSARQAGKSQALISAAEEQRQLSRQLYPMPGQVDSAGQISNIALKHMSPVMAEHKIETPEEQVALDKLLAEWKIGSTCDEAALNQAQADVLFGAATYGLGIVKVTQKPHIMGLDAESIDPEAFKAFGKTL